MKSNTQLHDLSLLQHLKSKSEIKHISPWLNSATSTLKAKSEIKHITPWSQREQYHHKTHNNTHRHIHGKHKKLPFLSFQSETRQNNSNTIKYCPVAAHWEENDGFATTRGICSKHTSTSYYQYENPNPAEKAFTHYVMTERRKASATHNQILPTQLHPSEKQEFK